MPESADQPLAVWGVFDALGRLEDARWIAPVLVQELTPVWRAATHDADRVGERIRVFTAADNTPDEEHPTSSTWRFRLLGEETGTLYGETSFGVLLDADDVPFDWIGPALQLAANGPVRSSVAELRATEQLFQLFCRKTGFRAILPFSF